MQQFWKTFGMVTQLSFTGPRAFWSNQTNATLGFLLPCPAAAPATEGVKHVQDAATHAHHSSPCSLDGSSTHRQHNHPVQRVNLKYFVRKQYSSFLHTYSFSLYLMTFYFTLTTRHVFGVGTAAVLLGSSGVPWPGGWLRDDGEEHDVKVMADL